MYSWRITIHTDSQIYYYFRPLHSKNKISFQIILVIVHFHNFIKQIRFVCMYVNELTMQKMFLNKN